MHISNIYIEYYQVESHYNSVLLKRLINDSFIHSLRFVVVRVWSYSFGHLDSVKRITLLKTSKPKEKVFHFSQHFKSKPFHNQTCFLTFEYQTCLVFRSPWYLVLSCAQRELATGCSAMVLVPTTNVMSAVTLTQDWPNW